MMPPLFHGSVTTEWLTKCLTARGYDAVVSGFSVQPIGAGMLGSTTRLLLSFSRLDPAAPSSVVLKVNGEGELSQKLGRVGYGFKGKPGFYESEVYFYREVAQNTSVRTPKCYFSWISDDGGQFCLLLEDISPAVIGDELKGCTLVEARTALVNLAGLHATRFNDQEFRQKGPLERINENDVKRFEGYYRAAVAVFMERHAKRHDQSVIDMVGALADPFATWFLADDQPSAFAHGDYRLDNMLFTATDPVQCVAVDWQSFTVSNPAFDVGYFLGASIPTDMRRANESELLHAYHDKLIALGVQGYDFEQCRSAFVCGAFFGVKNMVIALRSVTMTDRGQIMLDHVLKQACAAIADHEGASVLSKYS